MRIRRMAGFWSRGRKALAEVRKNLKVSEKLAAEFPGVAKFGHETKAARAKIDRFENEVNEGAVAYADLMRNYAQLKEADKFLMDNANRFLSFEIDALKTEASTGLDAAKMSERLAKLSLTNEVLELGDSILPAVWDAQAERDLKSLDLRKTFESIDGKIDALKSMTHSEDGLGSLETLKAASRLDKNALADLINVWSRVERLNKQREKTESEVIALTGNVHDEGLADMRRASDKTVRKVSFSIVIMVLGIVFAILTGVSIAVFITRAVTKPIRQVVRGLMEGTDMVASASSQAASSSQSLAEGASRQSQALQTGTASLEQIGSMTRQNAENALKANQLMQQTSDLIRVASLSMTQLTSAMTDIATANEDTQKIIKTIDEVAFQTRLLALNAAVEAARAGDRAQPSPWWPTK